MSRRATGIALALVTATISGFAVFLNGYAVKRFDDATAYTTAKNGIAAVLLILLALPVLTRAGSEGPAPRPRTRRHWLGLVAVGVIGGSVPFVLFFEGLARASSTEAAFIHKTLVIWVALLAVPLLGERLSWAHWAAIALLLAGQAVLVGDAGTVTLGSGELMIFGATLLWSVEVVVVKRLLASLAAPTLAAARLGIGLVVLLGFVALSGLERALGLRRRAVGLGAAHRRDPDRLRGHVVRGARPCAGGGCHGRARAGRDRHCAAQRRVRRRVARRARPRPHRRRRRLDRPARPPADPRAGMSAGALLFARYAYPPNALGYCGADENRTLLEYGEAGASDGGLVSSPGASRARGPTWS